MDKAVTRFKDPPPADMEPDPDYEPQVGEWFWFNNHSGWVLLHSTQDAVRNVDGTYRNDGKNSKFYEIWYKGDSLPAEPPE